MDTYNDRVNFVDTGCVIHPSCLKCPEAICIYELIKERRSKTANSKYELPIAGSVAKTLDALVV